MEKRQSVNATLGDCQIIGAYGGGRSFFFRWARGEHGEVVDSSVRLAAISGGGEGEHAQFITQVLLLAEERDRCEHVPVRAQEYRLRQERQKYYL